MFMFAVLFLLVRIIFKAFSKASNTFCLRIGEFYVSTETFLFEGRWEGSPNFWMGNFVFPSLNSTILSSPYQIFQYPVFTKRPHAPALKRGRCWANPWLEKMHLREFLFRVAVLVVYQIPTHTRCLMWVFLQKPFLTTCRFCAYGFWKRYARLWSVE